MKVLLESTTKMVDFIINGTAVPARIWEGVTDSGIPVHAFITRIAAGHNRDLIWFEQELQETRAPRPRSRLFL